MAIKDKGIEKLDVTLQKKIIIPHYQRPYKWSAKLVNQLIDDLLSNLDKKSYRLGTIVYCEGKNLDKSDVLEIVDGQQRLITLSLITKLLDSKYVIPLLNQKTKDQITRKFIGDNFKLIYQKLRSLSTEEKFSLKEFLLYKCEVVFVTLEDISEAFQFFDSQNARGKDLSPHDLLKAFHLREIHDSNESIKENIVKDWEREIETGALQDVMDNYLYRLRNWTKGKSAREFTKSEVDLFKGVTLETIENYNYLQPYKISHHFTESYTKDPARHIDKNKLDFPFQADQLIINGTRFFEYVNHYMNMLKTYKNKDEDLEKILKMLDNYPGKNRTGDRYIRNLFNCVMVYYIDRFGFINIKEISKLAFQWSYKIRLTQQAVKLATMDNIGMGKEEESLFHIIKHAVHPKEVINFYIEPIDVTSIKGDKSKIQPIIDKYKEIGGILDEQPYRT